MGACGLLVKAIALQLLLLQLSFIRGEWPEFSFSPSLSLSFTHFPNPPDCSFICKLNRIFRVYFVCTPTHADATSLDLQGPIFVHEPAYKVEFSNNTGGHVHCSGHASPYPEVIRRCFYFYFYWRLFVFWWCNRSELYIMQQWISHFFSWYFPPSLV